MCEFKSLGGRIMRCHLSGGHYERSNVFCELEQHKLGQFDERREHRLTRCRRDGPEVTSSALNKMREDLNPVATVVPKNQEEGSINRHDLRSRSLSYKDAPSK